MAAVPRRRWLFRLLAILIAFVPFLLLEGVLGLFGLGDPQTQADPLVGFSTVVPLFQLDEEAGKYHIASYRTNFFAYDEFPAVKATNTKRVFCLGGSTVQGRPYSIQTSFPTWMELALKEANPEVDWEVVNCGGISYASYRLVPILEEVLEYEPDYIILCTGHNEFLEDRSYAATKQIPEQSRPALSSLVRLRTVVVATQFCRWCTGGETETEQPEVTTMPIEVNALLDYHEGLAAYHRDDAWRDAVIRNFDANLQKMIGMCRAANVPILLLQPTSNLRGQPPFKSEHTPGLSDSGIQGWQESKDQANEFAKTDLSAAANVYQQAVGLNPQHAMTSYECGRILEIAGRYDEARPDFIRARDEDICPLRMISELESTMQRISQDMDVPFIDLHEFLEKQTPSHILGDEWLVDHVHPSFDGNQQIGLRLAEEFISRRWASESNINWREHSLARFKEHFATLDKTYFHRGQRMLQALRGWTRGEADGPHVSTKFPHLLDDSNEPPPTD
ncbi:MAG: SGNH/GDSL hydrolase family protein [Planctomycetaceae bacterium]